MVKRGEDRTGAMPYAADCCNIAILLNACRKSSSTKGYTVSFWESGLVVLESFGQEPKVQFVVLLLMSQEFQVPYDHDRVASSACRMKKKRQEETLNCGYLYPCLTRPEQPVL